MITQWLEIANDLCTTGRQMPDGIQFFGNLTYNVSRDMCFVKHGFVLSMYCLMRAGDIPDQELYDWAIKQAVFL